MLFFMNRRYLQPVARERRAESVAIGGERATFEYSIEVSQVSNHSEKHAGFKKAFVVAFFPEIILSILG